MLLVGQLPMNALAHGRCRGQWAYVSRSVARRLLIPHFFYQFYPLHYLVVNVVKVEKSRDDCDVGNYVVGYAVVSEHRNAADQCRRGPIFSAEGPREPLALIPSQ